MKYLKVDAKQLIRVDGSSPIFIKPYLLDALLPNMLYRAVRGLLYFALMDEVNKILLHLA